MTNSNRFISVKFGVSKIRDYFGHLISYSIKISYSLKNKNTLKYDTYNCWRL